MPEDLKKYYIVYSVDGFGVFSSFGKTEQVMEQFTEPSMIVLTVNEPIADDVAVGGYNCLLKKNGIKDGYLTDNRREIILDHPVTRTELLSES